jgi:hypothetical protein
MEWNLFPEDYPEPLSKIQVEVFLFLLIPHASWIPHAPALLDLPVGLLH